jgi:colicin import membrane protein
MRYETIRIPLFAVALAALAVCLAARSASADPPGDKEDAHKHPRGDDHGHKHPHGDDHGRKHRADGDKHGAAAPGAAAAKPAAQLPTGPELAKAADTMTASCAKAAEVRGRIEELAGKRRASVAAMLAAQNEARKQLRNVTAAQKKIERGVKKPGTDTAPLFEEARTAHAAAVAQNAAVERETQALRASEDELATLATSADQAAAACAEAEATVRAAANEARKAAAAARADAAKARGLARLPTAKVLEAMRAKQARDLEALKKSSDEARGAIDALKSVAATGAAAPAQAKAQAK